MKKYSKFKIAQYHNTQTTNYKVIYEQFYLRYFNDLFYFSNILLDCMHLSKIFFLTPIILYPNIEPQSPNEYQIHVNITYPADFTNYTCQGATSLQIVRE